MSTSSTSIPSASSASTTPAKICKVVVQQCIKAGLKFDTADAPVSIGKGMVVFICFLHGATPDRIDSIVKAIMTVKLSEPDLPSSETSNSGESSSNNVRRKSVVDCDYDILVVPQATLGGKLKGTGVQYHGLVSKDLGFELFHGFVKALKEFKAGARKGNVECGVYGARQILNMETNGPFTHVFEF
ncbi:unnamed protein product [Orchesella dallaii]|uniref:D-aminoacyl-tRNA deacylase n=1 Tax=Orchesella dallaii TaxID=48710 RepID=A0ABP1QQP4_9HEXA